FHYVGIRAQDDDGVWSLTTMVSFLSVKTGTNVNALEYFVDNDPGQGGATTVAITSGDSINVNFEVPLSGLDNGIHFVGFRTRDDQGRWSLTNVRIFLKESVTAENVTAAEYFIDTDPGLGSGTPVPISQANAIDTSVVIDLDPLALTDGFHSIGIRTKDSAGGWSLTSMRTFIKVPISVSQDVIAGEYYIDSDPGIGSGSPIPINRASVIDTSLVIDLDPLALADGFHFIGIRIKDESGQWSLAQIKPFLKAGIPVAGDIVACEYFIDTDPGLGSGTAVTIIQADTIDANVTIDLSALTLADGFHSIGIRTQDDSGEWSLAAIKSFVKSTPDTAGNITALEYYFTDSNETPTAPVRKDDFTAAKNIDVEFRADLGQLTIDETYTLHLEARDDKNLKSHQVLHEFTVVLDTVAPVVPQLSATKELGTITLHWSPNTEEDFYKYNLYRDTSSPATTLLDSIVKPAAQDTFYVDNNIVSEQTYYYRITTHDYDGNVSDYSDELTVYPKIIVSTAPTQNELAVAANADIQVEYFVDMEGTSFDTNSFIVYASQTGFHTGSYSYDSGTKTAIFNPDDNFIVGEVVSVTLTTGIQFTAGDTIHEPYEWSFTITAENGSGVFATKTDYATGSSPGSVFSSDLNGDGDMDLAVANESSQNISVLLNNGDGTFGVKTDYTTGSNPTSVFSADLDSDGDMDLVTANYNANTVSVLLNNGDATFEAKTDYATGSNPWSVFSSDLNGDGDMDLATANYGSNTVSILLNNSDGTFAPKVDYATGSNIRSVFSADLDGDGDMDLATANENSNSVSVLLNNGDGTFGAKTDYTTGSSPRSVYSADFNGDGVMDLAIGNSYSGTVSVLLNNGDGTFREKTDYTAGTNIYSIFSADLDGDEDMDLMTANYSSTTVTVLFNNSNGTFAPKVDYATGTKPYSIFSADLDDDGDMDLVTAGKSDDNVSILLNRNTAADIAVSIDSLEFGIVRIDSSGSLQFTVYNKGVDSTLQISNITSSNTFFVPSPTSAVILPLDSVAITVSFTPTNPGIFSGSLTIYCDDPNNSQVKVYLNGASLDSIPPDTPQNLTAIPVNRRVTLNWSPNTESDLEKYRLYRDTSSPATTLIDSVVASSPPDTFYIDTTVINGQTYYYRIKAVDVFGNGSGFSNEVEATPSYPGPVWHVTTTGSDVTGDGSEGSPLGTIQRGIDMVNAGDTVLVHPGKYIENINFLGKDIVVISTDGQDTTIIDGNQKGSVVTFNSGETLAAVLSGFTITNGLTNQNGGGIYCDWSSPTIENCTIKGNTADSGGGITIINGNPTLFNLFIRENTAVAWGGGIQISSIYAITIDHCIIYGNNAANGGGIHIWGGHSVTIKSSEISNNNGAEGIFFNGQVAVDIINSTIVYNSGVGLRLEDGLEGDNIQTPNIVNSIIYGNTGQQIYSGVEDILSISYSDIADSAWAGTGNINIDPRFVDAANNDYNLRSNSPCIDAGDPSSDLDPDSSIADMGAYYYDQSGQPLLVKSVVSTPSSDRIKLSWNSSTESDLAYYNIYRSETAGSDFTGTAPYTTTASTITEYTDILISPDATYYYRVAAENTSGIEGLKSREVNGRIAQDSTALDFNGTNTRVAVSENLEAFSLTDTVTFELYAQPRYTASGSPYIRTLLQRGNFELSMVSPVAGEYFPRVVVGTLTLDSPTSLLDDGWHHFAVVVNGGSNTVQLWVDGHLEATGTGTLEASGTLNIGMGLSNPFDGVIDEVRVSDVIRYTVGFIPPPELAVDSNTLALWHFNEGSADATTPVTYDISGHGAHGVIYGTPPWVAGPPFLPDTLSYLVINEIMANPSGVNDYQKEWLEIYNQGFTPAHLYGFVLSRSTTSHKITADSLLVKPGEYLVLGTNADSTTNGGVDVDYQYINILLLDNSNDEIILKDGMGATIDSLQYSSKLSFPITQADGKSIELHVPSWDNSIGANWLLATTQYGDGDYGTPGAVNSVYVPDIVVGDTSLVFSDVVLGSPEQLTVTIWNLDVAPLLLTSATTNTGDFSAVYFVPAEVAPGDSLVLTMEFNPARPGFKEDTLRIVSNDPDEALVTVALSGFAISDVADIDYAPMNIDFGITRTDQTKYDTLIIRNIGSQQLVISAIIHFDPTNYTINYTGSLQLDYLDSIVVSIAFHPADYGVFEDSIQVVNNDIDETVVTIPLSGKGSRYIVLKVPKEYTTIQTALDAAWDKDTVDVAPGTYFENIVFPDSNVVLRGAGPDESIIDGSGNGSVVTINAGLDSTTRLEGFTIRNGEATSGAGIYCSNSNPLLMNVIIHGNVADYGGGIILYNSNPSLNNVTVNSNIANNIGGGIYLSNSNPNLVNAILWNDTPEEVYLSDISDSISISYSDLQGGLNSIATNNKGTVNWGPGNIDANPLFVDAANNDYNLTWESPCIDAGDPSSPHDSEGTVVEMGAYFYDQSYQPPEPPVNLSGLPGNGQIAVTWSLPLDPRGHPIMDVAGYILFRGVATEALDSLAYLPVADTTYLDLGSGGHLINGESYRYSIVAIDTSDLYSVPSDTISVIPAGGTIVLADTLHDFGQVDYAENVSWDLIVENTGNSALNLFNISTSTSWFTVSDNSLTIPIADTDTVQVTFWPDFTSGTVSDTIAITSDDLDQPTVRIALSAESIWPVVDLSATELSFSNVKVYQAKTMPLALFNDGKDTLFVDSIYVTTDTVFTVAIVPNRTTLTLFSRIKDKGAGNWKQEIRGRGKGSNVRKQMTGNRTDRPFALPRRAGNNRSTITRNPSQKASIKNQNSRSNILPKAKVGTNSKFKGARLPIKFTPVNDSNRASMFNSDEIKNLTSNVMGVQISSNILPGDTLSLDITFFTSDTGSFASELRITSDDPMGNSDVLIPLSARSIAPAILLSTKALDFGNAWTGDSAIVKIDNVGTDTLHIVDITLPDDEFNTQITATDILPNATADLKVHFASLSPGYWEGPLTISSDAFLANQTNVDLKVIALPTETHDFGPILMNRDSTYIRSYDNGGNATLVIDSVVTTSSVFSVQISSNSIAPGQTLQVTTSFVPPTTTIYQADEILYTSQIGDGFTIAQLSGEGITYPLSDFSTKSLSVVTYKGNDTQFNFGLSNLGEYPLDYTIEVDASWYDYTWLDLPQNTGQVPGMSTRTIDINVVSTDNLDPGTYPGWLYFNTNSGTTPKQIVRTDTVNIFLNLLADDAQLASGFAAIPAGNPDPVNVLDADNNPIGLVLDFITSNGGTVNVLGVDAYPPIDSTTTYFDPSEIITNPVYAHKYFEIFSNIPTGYVVDIGFDYSQIPGILDASKLRLARRVNNAGTAVSWNIVNISETEIDFTNGLIIARNQTQFSQWVLLSNTGENLFVDVLAPTFGTSVYAPASPGILEDIVVSVPITDETGVASARLFYAVAGEWSYSDIAMVGSNGEFSATIPGTAVTHSGVVYFITATDLVEHSSVTDTIGVEIKFPSNELSTSSVSGSAYSAGYPSEKWRMLSIPAVLENNAVTSVIGDELGSQTDDVWRLFRYDAKNQTYRDKPSNFNYGEGYWLYQNVENNLMFAATSGQTGDINGSSITLKPLWNLIASPYSFPVDVQLDDKLFYGPITYGQNGEGWTGEITVLKPWNGYAVYNKTGNDQTILIDPMPQSGMLAKKQIEDGWILNLSATAGEFTDRVNPLGCLESAKDGMDYHDNPELLAPGNYLSLTYTNLTWGNVSKRLTSDIRELSEEVQIWDVSISCKGILKPAYLAWNFTQPLPMGQVTRIVDLARKKVLDTQENSGYKIGKIMSDIPYQLKVIAGYPEQVERAIEDIMNALPTEFALAQNFPNPFNPVTTLKFGLPEPRNIRLYIVNILGQEVVVLAEG
ncbi:MAG: DUF1573 domain-containing protein, partial [FCB group bacterium]|nr:DUF1573 domain-containing protein [FCB group bacterium]